MELTELRRKIVFAKRALLIASVALALIFIAILIFDAATPRKEPPSGGFPLSPAPNPPPTQ